MRDWRGFGILVQLSWVFALSVLLPLGAGIALDRAFHATPLFLFIGAILGIVIGTVGAVRIATRAIDEVERAHSKGADGEGRKEDKAS